MPAASGTIVAMLSPAASGGAGYYIKINHGKGLITEYMHQSKFNPNLKTGDKVVKGEIIGYVGSTGNSTGSSPSFRSDRKWRKQRSFKLCETAFLINSARMT